MFARLLGFIVELHALKNTGNLAKSFLHGAPDQKACTAMRTSTAWGGIIISVVGGYRSHQRDVHGGGYETVASNKRGLLNKLRIPRPVEDCTQGRGKYSLKDIQDGYRQVGAQMG